MLKILLFILAALPSSLAMASTIAINVLMTPDEVALDYATLMNKDLYAKFPSGFRFDDSHLPHITLLQAYVDVVCLDDKWDDIEKEVKLAQLIHEALEVKGVKVEATTNEKIFLTNMELKNSRKIIILQKKISDILKSCRREDESTKAYYGHIAKDDFILAYVKNFESQHSGDLYSPHLTLGVGQKEEMEKLVILRPAPPSVTIERIGVFRMGHFGTARERLFSYDQKK
jgi:hypothetical protein